MKRLVYLIVGVLVGYFLAGSDGGFQEERDRLLIEVANWQLAAEPAILARGWEEYFQARPIRPADLAKALNPCVMYTGFVLTLEECREPKQGIPIRIALKVRE